MLWAKPTPASGCSLGQVTCYFMPHGFAHSIPFAKNKFSDESMFYFKAQLKRHRTSKSSLDLPLGYSAAHGTFYHYHRSHVSVFTPLCATRGRALWNGLGRIDLWISRVQLTEYL